MQTVIHEHKRHLFNGEFIEASDYMSNASIKRLLNQRAIQPILFDDITAAEFMTWIVSLRTKSGNKPGYLLILQRSSLSIL